MTWLTWAGADQLACLRIMSGFMDVKCEDNKRFCSSVCEPLSCSWLIVKIFAIIILKVHLSVYGQKLQMVN